MDNPTSLSVYERIEFKAKNGIVDLSQSEREALEDIMIESFSEYVTRISDEELISLAIEKGDI